jgi:GNAT superfamily N-acetyltransferase
LLIRTYREGDEDKIFELHKAVYHEREYNKESWIEWWRWMYRENPAGKAQIWLAEHDGRMVGQYPLIFMSIKVKKEILKVCQNIDVMTHPDYRGQGIFSKLERRALDEAVSRGVYITIGFPNQAAYPGHIKSGWFDIATMRVMVKPLNWNNTLRIRVSNMFLAKLCGMGASLVDRVFYRGQEPPIVEGLSVTQVPFFDDQVNELWANVSGQYKIMVVRDRDYLNWRYCAVPGVDYSIYIATKARQLCGYLVLRCMSWKDIKLGIIFDVLAQSQEIAQCLVFKGIEHCKRENADLVYHRMIANKTHIKTFRKNGFISIPLIKGGRFCAYSRDPHISREFLRDAGNWFIQPGDSDMI